MIKQNRSSERRRFTRFKVKGCSFALSTMYGPLIDISPDGLGFLHIQSDEPKSAPGTGVLFSETTQCCGPLPIRKLWHQPAEKGSVILRRSGVQFGEMTQEHYALLESVILKGYRQDRQKIQPTYGELIARVNELEKQAAATIQDEKTAPIMLICSHCKKIKDGRNIWHKCENFISSKFCVTFSHGICPACSKKYYPHVFGRDE